MRNDPKQTQTESEGYCEECDQELIDGFCCYCLDEPTESEGGDE